MVTTQVNTRLESTMVEEMDEHIDGYTYRSRAHVISLALREWLDKQRKKERGILEQLFYDEEEEDKKKRKKVAQTDDQIALTVEIMDEKMSEFKAMLKQFVKEEVDRKSKEIGNTKAPKKRK